MHIGPWTRLALLLTAAALHSGCASIAAQNAAIAVGMTTGAGHFPTSHIHQVYYLGVFDPRDQLPPTIYRVRVQGQASALALTKFASGWVRAELVDSLSGRVALPADNKAGVAAAEEIDKGALTGRRLVMFGPEGFREAPRDHRLVVVMGSDPEAFFSAVDQALGVVAQVTQGSAAGPEIEKALWTDLAKIRVLRQQLDLVLDSVQNDRGQP